MAMCAVNSDEELDPSNDEVDPTEGSAAEDAGSEMSYLDVSSSEEAASATEGSVGPAPGERCSAVVVVSFQPSIAAEFRALCLALRPEDFHDGPIPYLEETSKQLISAALPSLSAAPAACWQS